MSTSNKHDDLEHVLCDLCGNNSTELYCRAKSRYSDRFFNVVRCMECGLIYVNPRQAEKERLIREHSSGSALTGGRQDTFAPPFIERNHLLAKIRLKQIQKFLPAGRLLDFGCGNGTFVFTSLSEGWDALGIDLNKGLIKAANRYWKGECLGRGWQGARMELGDKLAGAVMRFREIDRFFAASTEAFARENAESFDVVNSSQVLEHLVSPSRTISDLAKMLKRGGLFIADVPNIRCWRERMNRGSTLNPTAHLYYFDRSTMKRLLENQGLEIVLTSTRITLFDVWMKALPPLGLKRIIPRLVNAMRFSPDSGLGSDLIVVARKKQLRER